MLKLKKNNSDAKRLIVIVNTIAECLRTDCNILEDKIKKYIMCGFYTLTYTVYWPLGFGIYAAVFLYSSVNDVYVRVISSWNRP